MASRKAFWIGLATTVLLAMPLTAQAQPPYITTDTNTTLVSFNDGEAGALVAGSGAVTRRTADCCLSICGGVEDVTADTPNISAICGRVSVR